MIILWWSLLSCAPEVCDADGDSFGCEVADCDDADPFVFPGAAEACDGVDNDCSGAADEPWDDDHDGWSECGGDCDENDARNAPGLAETCDGVDNDCDGTVDEGFDADADGVTTCRGDCDDAHAAVYPGAHEACDGIDNDCDDTTQESADLDHDQQTLCEGDCDDLDPTARVGAEEVCDGVDNDCNGQVDEIIDCWNCVDVDAWKICPVEVTWTEAREVCGVFGGDLAVIDDAADNAALAEAVASVTWSSAWIGLSDLDEEGAWRWVDGAERPFAAWAPGEPNDANGEDCAGTNFSQLGDWNDFACATWLPFACQVP